ncbi:FadR/GntR family transcriptional regulator [Herbiconiux sp. A18JL235]|uniref:FadR/GntR family transcriptional regulator n=1 Tax=Herbiconiux sp. A18JL235 TaxID=3152363 RepID=A0AB39BG51_9MICO
MTVTDEAILTIKGMILSGELQPGDRLPPEKELSERLGLSRSSMREAVKALEVLRVLDVRRGDGTYVTSLEPELLLEAMSFVVDARRDDESMLELFAVRRILEPAAAALATPHLDRAAVAALRASIEEAGADPDVERLVAHDLAFHADIVRAAGNGYLSTLLESLSGRTARARLWRGLTDENAVERTLREHAALVDAIEAGDAVLVEALAIAHIAGVETWLRRWSGADSTTPPH